MCKCVPPWRDAETKVVFMRHVYAKVFAHLHPALAGHIRTLKLISYERVLHLSKEKGKQPHWYFSRDCDNP